jgi:uncharacterized protein YtpQ (UPF0354 family)
MPTTDWTRFSHPGGVYRLEYPAHWEHLEKDQARSCGFGPRDRDDVGLWISLMPISVDTDRLVDELPGMLGQAIRSGVRKGEIRRDPTLRHYGVKVDAQDEGQGGHHWLIAGGDVVLYASTDVPATESHVWNPIFERLLASLEITREDELAIRQLTNEVLVDLQERHPEEHFRLDEKGIRGDNRVVYLSNLHRDIRAAPARRSEIIRHFVRSLGDPMDPSIVHGTWSEAQDRLLPILKPRSYVGTEAVGKGLLINEWLDDVVICYALRSKNIFRFVATADADRWQMDAQAIHRVAIENLSRLDWPTKLDGARLQDGGRVILIATGDGLASSRLLHPGLHKLLSGPLGSPFRAGIPDRDTLVVYTDRHRTRLQTERQLGKDHRKSSYPITPRPFLVTPDGIAPVRR